MTCGSMSFNSMPAVSAMTAAVTSTGIRWRHNCQKSCHHQRPKRRTKYLLHFEPPFLLISLKEAALVASAHEKFYCAVTEKLTTNLFIRLIRG
jgi:precorrin-6B methylase 1